MKKSLLAVAAIGAFASAAQAQSSVTVYGILDVGYIGSNTRGFTDTGASTKSTANSFGNSAESTSRLGFKGNEDLGGGLSAFFTLEVALQPNTQGTSASGNGPIASNRQTFAGLGKKGLGQASLGTQYTVIHTAIAATSANQQNNMAGDVIYPIAPGNNGNVGAGVFGTAAAANAQTVGSAGTTTSYTTRTNNMLKVTSDNFAGFVGTAFYTMADANTSQTATTSTGQNNKNGWGLGVNYTWKKLLVSANYQALKAVQNPGAAVGVWTDTATASNVQDNQMYFAGSYDFGILKAYAQYINRKATSELASSDYLSRTAQQIGVRSFITPTIEAWASGGTGRFDSYGASTPTVNFTGYQLGSNYWLSKRTNLYAIFGSFQQSSSTVATQPSAGYNNYAVGVRHTF